MKTSSPLRIIAFAVCLILGASLTPSGAGGVSEKPGSQLITSTVLRSNSASQVTYDIQADIDGQSDLILTGATAHWYHMDFNAPGTSIGQNLPTVINGTDWYPTWPQSGTNSNCNCDSSTFNGVSPSVPTNITDFSWVGTCRDSCSVTATSDTLTINFNDDPSLGDTGYQITVTVTYGGGSPGPTTTTTPPTTTTSSVPSKTSSSFAITKVVPARSTAVRNGARNPLDIYWSGKSTFPVVANYKPTTGCGPGCVSAKFTFKSRSNPLKWPRALWCTSTGPLPPSTGKWWVWLTDARGKNTNKVIFTLTCVN